MISPGFKKVMFRIPLIIFPWCSGLLCGITTSFIKGFAETIKAAPSATNVFEHPLPYICLAICGVTIVA